ncbi:hypothetical protein, partial [Nocardioides abyssi]
GAVGSGPISAAFGCTSADTETVIGSENSTNSVVSRSYPIPNGTYLVNLFFAETNAAACVVGNRTVDITVEGTLYYGGSGSGDGFDQYAVSLA